MIKIASNYNLKLIKAGHIVKLISYEEEVWQHFKKKNTHSDRIPSEEEKQYNRKRYLKQSADHFIELIQSNHHHWKSFWTLTFDESIVTHNPQNVTECNYQFRQFIKRLKYQTGDKDIKYIAVIEFQGNGNVHYHILLNKYIDVYKMQNDIWKMGICHVNRCRDVDNLGRYMAKYMCKDFGDHRLRNNKAFFRSRNLDKPLHIPNPSHEQIKQYIGNIELTKQVQFDTEHKGTINIKEFNLKRQGSKV